MDQFLVKWQEPFLKWQLSVERLNQEIPNNLNLETIDGMIMWLSHPSNWRDTEVFIIGWNGLLPWISRSHAWKLAPNCKEARDLAEVVVNDRNRRRARHKKNDKEDYNEHVTGEEL